MDRRDISADVTALIDAHGEAAYGVARRRARQARAEMEHWDRVRREIGRRQRPSILDVATRMLERR